MLMRPIIFFIILFLPLTVESQSPLSDTLLLSSLDSITVTATRLESRELDAPLSLTVVSQNLIQSAQQQLSLNESLANVPGLLALNADNFAQDARIAIRGFGARSAFGGPESPGARERILSGGNSSRGSGARRQDGTPAKRARPARPASAVADERVSTALTSGSSRRAGSIRAGLSAHRLAQASMSGSAP